MKLAETTNANSNNTLDGGAGGEHATNARVMADVQADIKAGPGTGAKPKPVPAKKHTMFPAKGGRKR